jgi:hypothetical protein
MFSMLIGLSHNWVQAFQTFEWLSIAYIINNEKNLETKKKVMANYKR